MTLGLHNLKPAPGALKTTKRRGRGNSSGAGSYSGRGQKGQRARSGGTNKLKRRGLLTILRNKPKIGGFTSLKGKLYTVNIGQLDANFASGEVVTAKALVAKKLVRGMKPGIKILGDGTLSKPLKVVADAFSESAKAAILKVGGSVEARPKPIVKKTRKIKK